MSNNNSFSMTVYLISARYDDIGWAPVFISLTDPRIAITEDDYGTQAARDFDQYEGLKTKFGSDLKVSHAISTFQP